MREEKGVDSQLRHSLPNPGDPSDPSLHGLGRQFAHVIAVVTTSSVPAVIAEEAASRAW